MWAWAALVGGLAIVLAADLAGSTTAIERHEFSRDGVDAMLDPRARRAQSLARNFAAWHQAALVYVQLVPNVPDGELDAQQVRAWLPGSYARAGAWRSTLAGGTVRSVDDGATVAGIATGEGMLGRFLAAAVGYSGYAGLGAQAGIVATRGGGPVAGGADGRNARITPGGGIADGDRNHVP